MTILCYTVELGTSLLNQTRVFPMIIMMNRNTTFATAFPATGDAPSVSSMTEATNGLVDASEESMTQTTNLQVDSTIFHPKKTSRIACWNVRSFLDPDVQALTIAELKQYNIDIACLSETRIPENGTSKIHVPGSESEYYHLFHSGPNNNSGQHGVAIAIRDKIRKSLMSWSPISPRLASIRLRGKYVNISIVAVYAPTLSSSDEVKDDFYRDLKKTLKDIPRRDLLIIAGDWNARVGPSDPTWRDVIGNFGMGNRCTNGDRLLELAREFNLVVTNTMFRHPRRHTLTWYSNDKKTRNQIDYILVSRRWRSSILDSRVYRGAETGAEHGSDHKLVCMRLMMRFASHQKTNRCIRLDCSRLKNPEVSSQLNDSLQTSFSDVSSCNPTTVLDEWNTFKNKVQSAASDILGTTQRKKSSYISSETLKLVELRRSINSTNSAQFREIRKLIKQSARKDQEAFWDSIAREMEQAASNGDTRKLYRLIRQSSNRSVPVSETIRDANGLIINDLSQRLARWQDHFQTLLNHPPPTNTDPTLLVTQPRVEYDASIDPPSLQEVDSAIQKLKTGKSPGEDGIPPEILKCCSGILAPWILRILLLVWEHEVIPQDWSDAIILPFYKKLDKTNCKNYRGISLLDITGKVFAIILLNRFQKERDSRTRTNQGGFRPGRGCSDQIFSLRRILEHRWQYQQPTITCFVDFTAAFDSIHRDSLWRIMEHDGIPSKLLRLIQAYYNRTRACVRAYSETSDQFDISTGVRQGCILSPTLFNYAVDYVMKNALDSTDGVLISHGKRISDLDYADDVALLASSEAEMQSMLTKMNTAALAIGLKISCPKTKFFTAPPDLPCNLSIDGQVLDRVDNFTYLGSSFTPSGQAHGEINIRIGKAWAAFQGLRQALWNRHDVSLRTKLRVFNTSVMSILLYACETWPLRVEDVRSLNAFHHRCLRAILRVRYQDHITNDTVRSRCGDTRPVSVTIKERRLRWLGHVLRKDQEDLAKSSLMASPLPSWRRKQGGQIKTWKKTVLEDLEAYGGSLIYGRKRWEKDWPTLISDVAQHRDAWRALIRDIIS